MFGFEPYYRVSVYDFEAYRELVVGRWDMFLYNVSAKLNRANRCGMVGPEHVDRS